MQSFSPERLHGIAADIQIELKRLQRLADDIAFVRGEIVRDPGHSRLFDENLAHNLHNFYTGRERIFQTIATELNGAPPEGFDWHHRLLERMGMDRGDRPAVLSSIS